MKKGTDICLLHKESLCDFCSFVFYGHKRPLVTDVFSWFCINKNGDVTILTGGISDHRYKYNFMINLNSNEMTSMWVKSGYFLP